MSLSITQSELTLHRSICKRQGRPQKKSCGLPIIWKRFGDTHSFTICLQKSLQNLLTNPPFCGIIYTTKGQDPKTREVIIMNKTIGIVRRIDDLGRVVIPRELRKMLDIREGDPLNIQITDKEIIISKYQPTKLLEAAKNVVEVLASSGIGVTAYDVYEKKIAGDGDDVANLAEIQESKLVYTIGEDEEQCVYIVADALVVSFEARLVIEAVVEIANKGI